MDSFVLANIAHRRTRSAITILGVAIGVILVTLTVGLAHGQLSERGRREIQTGAEILMRPPGSGMASVSATLAIDETIIPDIAAIEGVDRVIPLGQHLERVKSGFGWRSVDAVNLEEYAALSGLKIVEGRAFTDGAQEAIVDQTHARDNPNPIGKTIEMGGTPYTIVGIFAPESMSRVKIPLSAMQAHFNAKGFASMLLVKTRSGADPDAVALAIRERFADYQIIPTRDLPAFYTQGIPALNTFLNVVIGLSLVISTLVILLAMYTTVMERTRQIGILKSLGASRTFIASAIEREALVISLIGVLLGYALALVSGVAINKVTSLTIEFEPIWFLATGVIGVLSGLLGALYPAIRAASLDPVKALSYD